ncbi:MAG: ISNCY family transposase, partial [Gemmatimonadaceae bacterium]
TSMSERELRRLAVLGRMAGGELTSAEGAELLALSVRQAKRLRKRFVVLGAKGVVHGNVSRPSNHARAMSERSRVLDLIRERYSGPAERGPGQRLGPTLAAEHLREDEGIDVPVSTLRRWMKAEGLWSRKRKWHHRFRRRERRSHFGELLQLDGSFHEWLEGRGSGGCLMTMTDDATSTELAVMGSQETLWSAVDLLKWWIREYGVPRALYTDLKTLYHSPGRVSDRDDKPLTHFGLMCRKLGIELIPAFSPQAKGRVERAHGTNQDRLVKKLRLRGISTHEGMNRYLREIYLPAHNARFAKPALEAADFHLPLKEVLGDRKPGDIWCRESARQLSNDGIVSYGNRKLQVTVRRDMPRKSKVLVREVEDGSVRIIYRVFNGEARDREHDLKWREFLPDAKQVASRSEQERSASFPVPRDRRPGPRHPWRLKNNYDVALAMKARAELEIQTTPERR